MFSRRKTSGLASVFGALELRVLEALWRRGDATVRELCEDFPSAAYTTLMTTMDRLHRKGVLLRDKAGRRFAYQPKSSREALLASLAGDAVAAILGPKGDDLRPMVSFFVDAVQREDRDVLAALDALVKERRAAEEDLP